MVMFFSHLCMSHAVSLCGGVQVLPDTLSPAWCETLLFDRVLLEGVTEELQQDPPLIIINFFSYNNMVCSVYPFIQTNVVVFFSLAQLSPEFIS